MNRKLNAIAMVLMLVFFVCAATGCRTTDFFTEVILTWDAETEDTSNPDRETVNSPDATEENDKLSSLDWSEKSKKTTDVEKLVVYSKEPTTELTSRHSLYALKADLEDVESSDPVKLVYNKNGKLDEETETDKDDESADDAKSKSSGQEQTDEQQNKATDSPDDSTKNEESKAAGSGDDSNKKGNKGNSSSGNGGENTNGGDGSGKGENGSGSSGDSDDSGSQKNEDGGYDGNVNVYDPGSARSQLQTADSIAACGQAAVVVQAIGGEGALAAIDRYTYSGKATSSKSATWAASFADVFGDELPSGFEKSCVLWQKDGSSSDDVADIDALVSACGENGVIMYEDNVAGYTTRFSDAQLAKIEAAGIQLVPIDLSSVAGMKDAAKAVAEILGESSHASFAKETSNAYCDFIDDCVTAVAATHGGGLAAVANGSSTIFTDYANCPVSVSGGDHVAGLVAIDFESGVSYSKPDSKSAIKVDTTGGLLFSYTSYKASTTAFWMQAAGVVDRLACEYAYKWTKVDDAESSKYRIVWKNAQSYGASSFSGYSTSGPFSNLSTFHKDLTNGEEDALLLQINWRDWLGYVEGDDTPVTVGTATFPYLIVSSTVDTDSAKVKSAVVASINSSDGAYSAESGTEEWNKLGSYQSGRSYRNAFTDDGVSASDCVRENPNGLLGSWVSTEGSIESVLESVWLAQIYSASPSKCQYEPVCDMSSFSVKLDGTTCSSLEQVVEQFYQIFYRCENASSYYSEVVPDEGVK